MSWLSLLFAWSFQSCDRFCVRRLSLPPLSLDNILLGGFSVMLDGSHIVINIRISIDFIEHSRIILTYNNLMLSTVEASGQTRRSHQQSRRQQPQKRIPNKIVDRIRLYFKSHRLYLVIKVRTWLNPTRLTQRDQPRQARGKKSTTNKNK